MNSPENSKTLGDHGELDDESTDVVVDDATRAARDAFVSQFNELQNNYPDYWVAFDRNQLIEKNRHFSRLMKRLRRKYSDVTALSNVFLTTVTDSSYETYR